MGIKNILLIGAGNIAGGYDNPKSKKVLTHLGAINRIKSNKVLIDIVDPSYQNYYLIKNKWNVKGEYYSSIKDVNHKKKYDVILITCNTKYHLENIKYITENLECKLILCEKPCCNSFDEISLIERLCLSKSINLYINYQRRLICEWTKIKQSISSGIMGSFEFGNIYYSKGLINNCSHAINLLYFIFDKKDISIQNIYKHIYDYSSDDPTLTFSLNIDNKTVNFIGLNDQNFSIFEIDLIFQKERIKCIDSGTVIERYKLSDDEIYKGYKSLNFVKSNSDSKEPFLNLWQIIESEEINKLKDIKVDYAIETYKLIDELISKC